MVGLFGAAWAVTAGAQWFWKASPGPWLMVIVGLGLIYSMSRVYLLRAVAPWNSWRTPVTFFLSAIVLGTLGINLFLPKEGWLITACAALIVELGLMLTAQNSSSRKAGKLRTVLLVVVIVATLLAALFPHFDSPWQALPIFLIALAAEAVGRWQFYTARVPFLMSPN